MSEPRLQKGALRVGLECRLDTDASWCRVAAITLDVFALLLKPMFPWTLPAGDPGLPFHSVPAWFLDGANNMLDRSARRSLFELDRSVFATLGYDRGAGYFGRGNYFALERAFNALGLCPGADDGSIAREAGCHFNCTDAAMILWPVATFLGHHACIREFSRDLTQGDSCNPDNERSFMTRRAVGSGAGPRTKPEQFCFPVHVVCIADGRVLDPSIDVVESDAGSGERQPTELYGLPVEKWTCALSSNKLTSRHYRRRLPYYSAYGQVDTLTTTQRLNQVLRMLSQDLLGSMTLAAPIAIEWLDNPVAVHAYIRSSDGIVVSMLVAVFAFRKAALEAFARILAGADSAKRVVAANAIDGGKRQVTLESQDLILNAPWLIILQGGSDADRREVAEHFAALVQRARAEE